MSEIKFAHLKDLINSQSLIPRDYNFYDLIKLRIVSAKRKFIDFFEKEYSVFKSTEESDPDIELIQCNIELNSRIDSLKFLGKDYSFNNFLTIISGIRPRYFLLKKRVKEMAMIGSIGKKLLLFCREDMLPEYIQSCVIEPLFRIYFNLQGYELIHSSCVSDGDKGYLFPAWRNTGKTSIILHLCLNENLNFISDDWTVLSKKGELLAYPKPVQIFEYNLREYPNLLHKIFSSRLKRLIFKGKLKISSRKVEIGAISKNISTSCNFHTVIMPIRWSKNQIKVSRNVNQIELAQKIVACANYEHYSFYRHLYSSNFQLKIPYEKFVNLLQSQVEIIGKALQNSICHELYIPKTIPFTRIIDVIKDLIK